MPLSLAQVYDICLATDSDDKCCRYLSQDASTNEYHCLKKSKFKDEIDEETVNGMMKNLKMPKGDNCEGYPVFIHLTVGYDIKST
jgi:hypothetical protein